MAGKNPAVRHPEHPRVDPSDPRPLHCHTCKSCRHCFLETTRPKGEACPYWQPLPKGGW